MASYVAAIRSCCFFLEDGTADRKMGDTVVKCSFMSSPVFVFVFVVVVVVLSEFWITFAV